MPKADRVPRPAISPDWSNFKLQMFANSSYQRVSNASENQLAVGRLETFFAIEGGELAMAIQLWEMMISSCPASMQPTATEADAWAAISVDNDMPISFDGDGLLVVQNDS
ncbi:hypothetical protein [cf. Phormidesmis sp. LEGE 11477]|uniref:hypothetical protein n=1 Tax=cf. Phormidesmis sp. LEGE 11477 TaxID=1828680 RepID=UPI001880CD6B|nr:hypothetical protein [cf. Phormidesmis sp. LEGE 11477]MBE9064149.1 hypothetical protein [cf. Phormidesmis sp. LEGE 11477]